MITEAEKVYQLGLWSKEAYYKTPTFVDYYSSATVNMGLGVTEWGSTVVACAGSRDVRDFIDDATAIPFKVPELDVLMHAGFVEGYEDAIDWLHTKLHGPACFVGHSLGAPHASLMAVLCANISLSVEMLVLLESPRPGFSGFRDLVQKQIKTIYSFRNGPDWVPDLPPELLGWRHVIEQTDLNHPASGLEIESHMVDQVLEGLKIWRDAQLGVTNASDHN